MKKGLFVEADAISGLDAVVLVPRHFVLPEPLTRLTVRLGKDVYDEVLRGISVGCPSLNTGLVALISHGMTLPVHAQAPAPGESEGERVRLTLRFPEAWVPRLNKVVERAKVPLNTWVNAGVAAAVLDLRTRNRLLREA